MALDQHRLGQAQQASRVGKHADGVDASSDFLTQPARAGLWTRSVPVPVRELGQGEHVGLRIYEHHGYRRVGERKGYYPANHGLREDAVVMSLKL